MRSKPPTKTQGGCAFCGTWEDGDEDFYDIAPSPEGVKTSVWVGRISPKK